MSDERDGEKFCQGATAMSPRVRRQIAQEVDLIGKFAETYRRKFSALIDRMNRGADSTTDLASLRLCVEAVDMMLSNQTELAKVLRAMTSGGMSNDQAPMTNK
jgi:hypothetical protein